MAWLLHDEATPKRRPWDGHGGHGDLFRQRLCNCGNVLHFTGSILLRDQVIDFAEVGGKILHSEEPLKCAADVVTPGKAYCCLDALIARGCGECLIPPMQTPTSASFPSRYHHERVDN